VRKPKITRRAALGLAALTVMGGAAVAAAGPASAAPTGCGPGWPGIGNTYVTATCTGGTGTFQVWAQCHATIWPYWYDWAQSSWMRPGQTAWAICPVPDTVVQWGISRRN
jgi:hypothetical protein